MAGGAAFVYPYVRGYRLPQWELAYFWLLFGATECLVVVVHELGHALATWAVGYRLRIFRAGPITVRRTVHGRLIWQFDRTRFFSGEGFCGGIPRSPDDKDLRFNQMLILFAGPFATLNCAAILFLLLISLPGSIPGGWWGLVALGTVLFFADFFPNLTPVGRSDGNRLLQLALRSADGDAYLRLCAAVTDTAHAEESKAKLEFDDEVASRTKALEQILAGNGRDRLPLAVAWQNLGIAQFHAGAMEEAEANLNASLETLRECRDAHPALEGNAWSVLCHIHRIHHQADKVRTAYERGLAAFRRAEQKGGVDPVQHRLVLASLHLHARHLDLALAAIEEGFTRLAEEPAGAPGKGIQRAIFLRLEAACEFDLGRADRGLAAAREAAAQLRSCQAAANEARRATVQLAILGTALWRGGESAAGILIENEAVEWLEKHGARKLAARVRVDLAGHLRREGRSGEAEAALPAAADLPENRRADLASTRGRIRLAQHRFDDAVGDLERAVSLHGDHLTVAGDKSGLAEALFGCGRPADAEREAREALEILLPSGHPDAAGPLITLALIGWQNGESGADAQFEHGVRCIAGAPLLEPAMKARSLQEEARRLHYYSRVYEAARAEAMAREQRGGVTEVEFGLATRS